MTTNQISKVYRIAFILPRMDIGGVEKSLLALLDVLRKKQNLDITVLLFQKEGVLLSQIPDGVKVEQIAGMDKNEKFRSWASKILTNLGLKFLFDFAKHTYHKYGSRYSNKDVNENVYDIAIGYQDGAATWYTAKNIAAEKKIAFIHTDFQRAKYNKNEERNVYSQFNQIYCVSGAARDSFIKIMPEFSNKTRVFPTIVNPNHILDLSQKSSSFQDDFDGLRLLTVGRLSHEKGLDKAIRVLKRLRENGYNVRWYVIGEGNEKQRLKKITRDLNVKHDFIFLNSMENPYGFMANCDIYVQPSNYEGYSIAVAEARVLSRPIVACDFSGAREQLIEGVTGIITGLDEDDLYLGVQKLVSDNSLRERFIFNLKKQDERFFEIDEGAYNELIHCIE